MFSPPPDHTMESLKARNEVFREFGPRFAELFDRRKAALAEHTAERRAKLNAIDDEANARRLEVWAWSDAIKAPIAGPIDAEIARVEAERASALRALDEATATQQHTEA